MMNKVVKTLNIISLIFGGIYLALFIIVIAMQKIYLPLELKEEFFLPYASMSCSLLLAVMIIITNAALLVKRFRQKHCVMPVVLSCTAYAVYLLCADCFRILEVRLIVPMGINAIAGINQVNSCLTLFTSFPLTVMTVTAIISAVIHCYHCKIFKEEYNS